MPERLLLCTDLDRTLIPNGAHPESPRARERFAALVARPGLVLAYVTGRHRQLVEDALDQYRLPLPDFVVGDVGTTIYRVERDGDWQPDKDWEEHISGDWNGRTNPELQRLFGNIPALHPQEGSKQSKYKLSYYVARKVNRKHIEKAINLRLQPLAVHARLVWSEDEPAATGLLDVLPRAAGKYQAVAWLQRLLGFTDDNSVFSGDSGNDIEVLASTVPAVLVANSEPAVKEQSQRQAAAAGRTASLYVARGGFKGMNGNYSAGILEGIAHYHPALEPSMDRSR